MNGNGDTQIMSSPVQQAGVATLLVVDIESGALQHADDFFRFQNWELIGH